MVHVLFGTVLTAAVVAGIRSLSGAPVPEPAPVTAEATPRGEAPQMPSMPSMPSMAGDSPAAGDDSRSGAIAGQVLEVIEVPSYSYLRVGEKGTDGTWVAVPTAGLSVGAPVRVGSSMKMTDFKSTALNRTFPVIYFGTLDGGDTPHAMNANPRGDGAMGDNPHAGMGANPHGDMAGPSPAAADVKPVAKADGPNGKTVAELLGQRAALNGKTVRIRGTVVKVNSGILGRTFLHLRDGSGDASSGTNDILVTTEATPALGDTILVEGAVALDRDIGAGYKFATMVEDAKVLKP